MAHAKGRTSIPLAAHHANPPNAKTIAAAPTAATRPASFSESLAASQANAPQATYDRIHAGHMIAAPRAPRPQNGARSTGQSMLVAPLEIGSPA